MKLELLNNERAKQAVIAGAILLAYGVAVLFSPRWLAGALVALAALAPLVHLGFGALAAHLTSQGKS